MRVRIPTLVVLLLFASLAGCTSGNGDKAAPAQTLTPVQDRHLQPFNVTGAHSHTLREGMHGILDGLRVDLPVDLPATEGGDAALDRAAVNLGLFLPDIEGCDWAAASLPARCQVPVIADVGPYYASTLGNRTLNGQGECPAPDVPAVGSPCLVGEGDSIATEPAHRLGRFLIENFVPHGYAVAQVSVFGTGDSTHCMDLMGSAEQMGVVAAVDWLGSQPWSNGAVGLIGRSYDGSTPWEAAMHAPPALKTIVPISGLIGQHDLMWRNGSAEFRGPGVLYGLYAAMTVDGDASDASQALCPDTLAGGPEGAAAYGTGDRVADSANTYWAERRFLADALANYEGSVYLIHGLQDWNVDNSQAFPTYRLLQDAGLEVKGLFGQWAHNYPDRLAEHQACDSNPDRCRAPTSVRPDWAQDLLEWFDHYLKGTGPAPSLHAEVQDNLGAWRLEASYPPRDARRVELPMSGMTLSSGQSHVVGGPCVFLLTMPCPAPAGTLTYAIPALSGTDATRIAGNVGLELRVTPGGPGGQVYAELRDANGTRLGHAIMDLRYAAGGDDFQPVVAGMPLVARMEFFAMDAVVPAGHGLELFLAPTGEDYLPSATSAPIVVDPAASVLRLPVVERGPQAFFTPPAYVGEPQDAGPGT